MGSRHDCKTPLVCGIIMVMLAGCVARGAYAAAPQNAASPVEIADESYMGEFFMDEPDRKDPFVAGLLSWGWPGLGQFYSQDYAMGSFFLLADIMQKGLFVYMLFYYSDKYSDNDRLVRLRDMETRDQTIIIGYVFSILVFKTVCVINALHAADVYNKDIYFPYWKSQKKSRLSFEMRPGGLNIGVARSF